MELNRRQALSVLGVTAIAATLPASAAKAATLPEILTIRPLPDEEGRALVIVRCAVPVVAVTARLLNHERTVEIARYEMGLASEADDPRYAIWKTPPMTGIPLGNCWMDLQATSADGGIADGTGEFFLWLIPTFTATVTPLVIDDAHRVVTIAGTVVGRHPVTFEVAPIASMPVNISSAYWPVSLPNAPRTLVTTGPDGAFTGQLTLAGGATIAIGNGAEPRVTLVAYGGVGSTVTVYQRPTRLALQPGATTVNQGEQINLDGLLETFVDDQWRPLTGRTVWIGLHATTGSDNSAPLQVTSDGQGRFHTIATPTTSGYYVASFNTESAGQFYATAEAQTEIVFVRMPVRFNDEDFIVRRTLNPYDEGMWEIIGYIRPPGTPWPVEIQFRPTVEDSWQTLATVTTSNIGSSEHGYRFTLVFQPPASGQVRAYSAQTTTAQAASSKIGTVWRPISLPRRPADSRDPGPLPPRRTAP